MIYNFAKEIVSIRVLGPKIKKKKREDSRKLTHFHFSSHRKGRRFFLAATCRSATGEARLDEELTHVKHLLELRVGWQLERSSPSEMATRVVCVPYPIPELRVDPTWPATRRLNQPMVHPRNLNRRPKLEHWPATAQKQTESGTRMSAFN